MSFKNRGFTLVELLITMGLISIISAISITNFIGYKKSQDFDSASKALTGYLRDAQQKAVSQDQSSKWGIHLAAPSGEQNFYEVFYGNNYNRGIKMTTVYLPKSLIFTDPSQDNSKDIIFSKLTGYPQGGANVIVISSVSDGTSYKTINISSIGLIELSGS